VEHLFEKRLIPWSEHIGETKIIVDDTVKRLGLYQQSFQSSINIPDRTVNVAYDSRITDTHVIQMTLLEAGYKTIK